jgi:hypothetical protein
MTRKDEESMQQNDAHIAKRVDVSDRRIHLEFATMDQVIAFYRD